MNRAAGGRGAAIIDAACLAAVTLASALPYLPRLGFYSDDWGVLAAFEAADRQGTLASTVANMFATRPVQGLYLAALFKLFGLSPLGYHIVNTIVIACAACLLYLLLLRLRLGRVESFATTLLFVMLPQLSTVRVWYVAFQIPLSMALMLVSMHLQLSFARSGKTGALIAAVVAALLSVAAYEIFAPLIAGFAAAIAYARWQASRNQRKTATIAAIALIALVLFAYVYKLVLSGRAGAVGDPHRYLLGLRQLVRLDYDWRVDSGLNLIATPRAYFWEPIRGWWAGAKALGSGQSGIEVIGIAILIAAISWWRLTTINSRPLRPKRLLLIGAAAFLLGNAIFLIVPSVLFTSTGVGNRVQVAAALGVAMIFVSLIALAASLVRQRNAVFAIVIVVVTTAALARLSAIESSWAEAPALQERILAAARTDLRDVPPSATVILDGICPYHGPAVVFEAYWDVGGALSLALGRPIIGDIVSPRMRLTPTGLDTSIYKEPSFYRFGPGFYVYNPVTHRLAPLPDARAAMDYFATRKGVDCRGFVGRGADV